VAGQNQNLDKISQKTTGMYAGTVVDVGGGTGASRRIWPATCRYICLDIEMPKLKGFRSRVPDGYAVLSDASRMPISTASVDVVLCMAVVHHLTDVVVDQMFDEAQRILKVGGHFILLEPVLNLDLWLGRLLWRLDRGSFPYKAEYLRNKLSDGFKLIHWEQYTIHHEYVLGMGIRT
jgi:ubiquinone/menaquinone biosynthesis C-methylase UbiE